MQARRLRRPEPRKKVRARSSLTSKKVRRRGGGKIADKANLGQMHGIMKALGLRSPKPSFIQDTATLSTLNDLMMVDIAQLLAARGFKAGDLRRAGADPAVIGNAAANHLRASSSLADEVLLSDTVVVGRVVSTNPSDDLGDGFRTSVEIVVDTVIKGQFANGASVKVRRASGVSGTSMLIDSSETPLANGAVVALLGSVALHDHETGPGKRCKTCVLEQVPVFLVNGDELVATGGSVITGTVTSLKQ
jgi:hypothetical protein